MDIREAVKHQRLPPFLNYSWLSLTLSADAPLQVKEASCIDCKLRARVESRAEWRGNWNTRDAAIEGDTESTAAWISGREELT